MCIDWYLVQIKPNTLNVAERNLHQQGFKTFMLKMRETRRGARFVERLVPLFPSYLFVGVHATSCDPVVIHSTRGVSRLVRSADKIKPISTTIIETLEAQCNIDGLSVPQNNLIKGDQVVVTAGPFAEYFGELHALSGDERVWVLLNVMGRGVLTELQTQIVQPVI